LGTQWQKNWKLNNKNSLIGGAEYIREDINEGYEILSSSAGRGAYAMPG